MDEKSLYQVDDVMVDRTALAYCIVLGCSVGPMEFPTRRRWVWSR
jgi:hypothetical protein